MRVFVTGATGFVGSAVVRELVDAGHQVVGLTRSEAGAAALEAAGAVPHRGTLEDVAPLLEGIAACDAVIHTGFNHDFSRFVQSCEEDGRLIEAIGERLKGSTRRFVVTAAIGVLPPGSMSTEDSRLPADGPAHPRAATERAVDRVSAMGVDVSVVRLPPSVHGAGDHGFVPILIGIARTHGVSAFGGDGGNLWPAVHRLDAARLYRLALEHGTPGARYHAVAETGVPMRDIAAEIGRGLGVPVKALAADQAATHFDWFARFAAMDCAAASDRTRAALGWAPTQPGLLADLAQGGYFEP